MRSKLISLQGTVRFRKILAAVLSDIIWSKQLIWITDSENNYDEHTSNFVFSVVPADSLMLWSAMTSADTVMTKLP